MERLRNFFLKVLHTNFAEMINLLALVIAPDTGIFAEVDNEPVIAGD